jgi:hypothetical protein
MHVYLLSSILLEKLPSNWAGLFFEIMKSTHMGWIFTNGGFPMTK